MFPSDSIILIVDDSSGIRKLIKTQLETLGFSQILEASNGKEAIEALVDVYAKRLQIDLIIADWRMPEMDGIELLKHLKSHEKYEAIPFLMVAAESDMDKIAQAISEGVTDFLVKPFDEDRLSEKLTAIWKRINREE